MKVTFSRSRSSSCCCICSLVALYLGIRSDEVTGLPSLATPPTHASFDSDMAERDADEGAPRARGKRTRPPLLPPLVTEAAAHKGPSDDFRRCSCCSRARPSPREGGGAASAAVDARLRPAFAVAFAVGAPPSRCAAGGGGRDARSATPSRPFRPLPALSSISHSGQDLRRTDHSPLRRENRWSWTKGW